MNKLTVTLGIIISLATIMGFIFTIDARFAKADRVVMLELRLDQKIVQDRIQYVQDQIWVIEDRYKGEGYEKPLNVIDRERRLHKQLKEQEFLLKTKLEKEEYHD